MAKTIITLKRPITQLELDLDENSLKAAGFIQVPKTKTRADYIRAMTDEELAKYIDLHATEAMWCNSPPDDCPPHDTCELCILDWLKSPIEKEK